MNRIALPITIDAVRALCVISPSGCWMWTGPVMNAGYGRFGHTLMHQHAFRLSRGHKACGLVCHNCDVKLCLNPDHLYDGTKSSNQRDAIQRGLSKPPPRKPEAVTEGMIRAAAQLMRDGATFTAAARGIGVPYQYLQKQGRRKLLEQYLGDSNQLS